jgi:prolyl-tRNA synthetase
LEKLNFIISDELDAIDCQKLSMPHLLSSQNWERTGRWNTIGRELIRVKDHKNHEFCLAPTHEECITDIVASMKPTFKQLPIRLYQIGSKFRDEKRPRGGLMRCKEFIMKDLYSFDATQEDAFVSYKLVYDAYCHIFTRMGLNYVAVEADSGNIGGSRSHEFQIVANSGEDTVLQCPSCKYAANVEKAVGKSHQHVHGVISLVVVNENGDQNTYKLVTGVGREANLLRIKSELNAKEVFVMGNESSDAHAINLHDKSVFPDGDGYYTVAVEGDTCVKCDGNSKLVIARGIEVGHVFYLGTRYSGVLNANFVQNETKKVIEMGCYGIGVSRVLQSIVETSNDDKGIIWPISVAPYRICVIPITTENVADAENISKSIEGIPLFQNELMMEDRGTKFGIKVRDALLIGYPFILLVGKKFTDSGKFELLERKTNTTHNLDHTELLQYLSMVKI